MAELWWSCPSCGLLSEPCSHTGSTRPLCVDCGMIGPACTCKTEPPRELTRDLLLSEIRRSLLATHPERAEALCAALEREMRPRCESCGSTDSTFAPNPYAEDVHDDSTPCWMCEPCREQSAADI